MPAGAAQAEDARREAILDATWRLIAERGYHAVRIADIAAACGTSTGTVHYYFSGKDDVLTEALKHCVGQAFARHHRELSKIDNAYERLLKLIDLQLPRVGEVRDEWSIWLQFWAEAAIRPQFRPAHNEYYAHWRETVERIVRRGQRQGLFAEDADPALSAMKLTALTDGIAIQVLTGASGISVTVMRELLVDFIRRELVVPGDRGHAVVTTAS
jgi:AcrR family transcriptional regulator